MTTLSFDVGIKNLAYCIIDNSGIIKAWGLINIIAGAEVECSRDGCQRVSTFQEIKTNQSFCGLHCRSIAVSDKKKIKQPKHKNITNQNLVKKLFISLNQHTDIFEKFEVEKVLIELQPNINQKMKFISHSLFNYLILRLSVDKSLVKDVKFCSAKYKLKKYYSVNSKGNNTKAQRKKDSIKCCREMLETEGQQEFLELFDKSKKKDDLADCFLQARYFC